MKSPNRRMLLDAAAALGAGAASARDAREPIIGDKGATILGPRNPGRESQNPDILRPPATDHGSMPNLRFSFADAHVKSREGGWSREVTQRELPISTTMAGVNMRLKSGGVRELHWHKQAEWSFMLAGRARITAVDNAISLPMSAPAISGISRPAFRIRSRDWPMMAVNFCWHFPTGVFGRQHLRHRRPFRAHQQGSAGPELQRRRQGIRPDPKGRAVHFPVRPSTPAGTGSDIRSAGKCSPEHGLQDDGADANDLARRKRANRQHAQLPDLDRCIGRSCRGGARTHA